MHTQPHTDTGHVSTYIIVCCFGVPLQVCKNVLQTRHITTPLIYSINFALHYITLHYITLHYITLHLQCKSYREALYTYFNKHEFWNETETSTRIKMDFWGGKEL